MLAKEINKRINDVRTTMKVENMLLKNNQIKTMKRILNNKITVKEAVDNTVRKYKVV